jgi:DNA-binding Xre family transcriptional regulator
MSQRTRIVTELKRVLRERGLTYTAVAKHLQLSEASVKRLFSTEDFSLERLDRICELADIELSELVERMQQHAPPAKQLTLAQEQEVVSDPRLFLIAWLVLNRWQFEDIVKEYKFTDRETLRYLIKLDRLKIIELQPQNRVRLLINRHFAWRAGGPVQNYIHQKLLKEFLGAQFQNEQDEFFFHGAVISDAALAQIKRSLRNAAHECTEAIDRDRSLTSAPRNGAALVLALRPWQYSGFAQFLRE